MSGTLGDKVSLNLIKNVLDCVRIQTREPRKVGVSVVADFLLMASVYKEVKQVEFGQLDLFLQC